MDDAGGSMTVVLAGYREGVVHAVGSGVIIGPGLILTAKHVIEEFYRNACPR